MGLSIHEVLSLRTCASDRADDTRLQGWELSELLPFLLGDRQVG